MDRIQKMNKKILFLALLAGTAVLYFSLEQAPLAD